MLISHKPSVVTVVVARLVELSALIRRLMTATSPSRISVALWLTMLLAIPPAAVLMRPHLPALGVLRLTEPAAPPARYAASPIPFRAMAIAEAMTEAPRITNVQIVDFDDDGRADVLACDAQTNAVIWYRQLDAARWEPIVLADDLVAPAHATVVDIDGDGDRDVLVAVLGNIAPDDESVGRVVLLENNSGTFRRRVILDDVQRVADVQPADFDGDGDLDLAVAVFGYARGSILWLENLGDGVFRDHELLAAPGAIHVPVADYDQDGDPDFAAVVSQEEEEVWAFENLGEGRFRPRQLFFTPNFDIGSAGLVKADLDGDGDIDLVLPVGDDLEDQFAAPQPYHGCLWLENLGGWEFTAHRVAQFGGTYAADCADLDGDGDQDIVLISMLNATSEAGEATVVWLENDGRQQFRPWTVAAVPTQLVTVACGDLDGDSRPDIVAGRLNLMRPHTPAGRITAWLSGSGGL